MKEELEPCRLCGSCLFLWNDSFDHYSVCCTNINCPNGKAKYVYRDRNEAIRDWNNENKPRS